MANTQQGDPMFMLENFFSAPKSLRRLRGGISGPHIDAFADDLERDGYAPASAVRYIRAAAHLGCFVQRKGDVLSDIDLNILDSFCHHLLRQRKSCTRRRMPNASATTFSRSNKRKRYE